MGRLEFAQLKTPCDLERAWIAGIFEGEGTIQASPSAQVAVKMTDEDIVGRLASLLGCEYAPVKAYHDNPVRKPQWRVRLCGVRAVQFLKLVRPWLGRRRGKRADEVLARWDGRTLGTPLLRAHLSEVHRGRKMPAGHGARVWAARRRNATLHATA